MTTKRAKSEVSSAPRPRSTAAKMVHSGFGVSKEIWARSIESQLQLTPEPGVSLMQRICFVLQVKRDKLQQYKQAHKHVWPEMLEALSRHGWHNYSLFLREDGMLIGYVETPDFRKAVQGMQTEDVNARWQTAMTEYFEPLKTGAADTSLQVLEQVFYLP